MEASGQHERSQWERKGKETLHERVHRHLSDITSEITDEDIRNVAIELEIEVTINALSQNEMPSAFGSQS